MKKGKTSKLDIFKNAKCSYGTVDSQEFKSLYISIQSWVEPKKEATNWDRVTGNMCRNIKHNLLESVDPLTFEQKNIVDLDLRSSGIQLGKRSFMNLEITLFLEKELDFKDPQIKDSLKRISKNIYGYCIF